MNYDLIEVDGRDGEGGGQVVRTSAALSALTGRPIQMIRARAHRAKPGLQAQHLTAVKAVATVCQAQTEGLRLGAQRYRFIPGAIRGGSYTFSVATAGSAALVMHAVLPVLLKADSESEVVFEGGTHNDKAPSFEHLVHAWLPALMEMGVQAELQLQRPGFYPKGGGRMRLRVRPWTTPRSFERCRPVNSAETEGFVHVGKLPEHVDLRARRQLKKRDIPVGAPLSPAPAPSPGPGLAVALALRGPWGADVVTALGARGRPTEHVVDAAIDGGRAFERAGAPVGEHLADQLLLYLALGAGGSFRTSSLSEHFRTQARSIGLFLGPCVETEPVLGGYRVRVRPAR